MSSEPHGHGGPEPATAVPPPPSYRRGPRSKKHGDVTPSFPLQAPRQGSRSDHVCAGPTCPHHRDTLPRDVKSRGAHGDWPHRSIAYAHGAPDGVHARSRRPPRPGCLRNRCIATVEIAAYAVFLLLCLRCMCRMISVPLSRCTLLLQSPKESHGGSRRGIRQSGLWCLDCGERGPIRAIRVACSKPKQ